MYLLHIIYYILFMYLGVFILLLVDDVPSYLLASNEENAQYTSMTKRLKEYILNLRKRGSNDISNINNQICSMSWKLILATFVIVEVVRFSASFSGARILKPILWESTESIFGDIFQGSHLETYLVAISISVTVNVKLCWFFHSQ